MLPPFVPCDVFVLCSNDVPPSERLSEWPLLLSATQCVCEHGCLPHLSVTQNSTTALEALEPRKCASRTQLKRYTPVIIWRTKPLFGKATQRSINGRSDRGG